MTTIPDGVFAPTPDGDGLCTCGHPVSCHWHTGSGTSGCEWHQCTCAGWSPISADAERLVAIVFAAQAMIDTCREALGDVAAQFTCAEADTIHALMVACQFEYADEWLGHHAVGDVDDGDLHVAVYDERGHVTGYRRPVVEPADGTFTD